MTKSHMSVYVSVCVCVLTRVAQITCRCTYIL